MGWYEGFFDESYLLVYGRYSEGRTKGELAALERYCPLTPGARLLDLACGTGRHSVPLAQQGYRVTGVELSPLYVEKARERAARKGVEVEFLQRDMRLLDYHEEFDGVLCMFNSFGYFDASDNRLALQRVHQALKPGGWVLLDVLDAGHIARNQHDGRTVQGGGFVLFETCRVEDGVSIVYQKLTRPGQPVQEQVVKLTLYTPEQMRQLLEGCGFRVEGQWGDLEGGPPATEATTRLFTLACRC